MNVVVAVATLLLICVTKVSSLCSSMHIYEGSHRGNMTLVLILPLRTGEQTYEVRHTIPLVEVFKFAVHRENERLTARNLNFTVGYKIHDNCRDEVMSTKVIAELILDHHNGSDDCECIDNSVCEILGIVGPIRSGTTVHVAGYASAEVIPIVGFSATSVTLSDKKSYPYFQRVIPPDDYQARVVADFVNFHGWKLVTILASDDEFGRMGMWTLSKLLQKANVCIAVCEVITRDELGISNVGKVVKMVQDVNKDEIIILWMYPEIADILFDFFEERKIFGKTFIASDGIGRYEKVLQRDPRLVQGMFVVLQYGGDCVECLDHVWNVTAERGRESYLEAFFKYCRPSGDVSAVRLGDCKALFDVTFVPYLYDAVRTYFSALTIYLEKKRPPDRNAFYADWNRTTFVDEYLRRTNFTGANDLPVKFDQNGDPVNALFHYLSVQRFDNQTRMYFKHIGTWSQTDGVKFIDSFKWSSERTEKPLSSCGRDCPPGFYNVPYSDLSCCWECWQCSEGFVSTGINQIACSACPSGTRANPNKTDCVDIQYEHLMLSTATGSAIVALSLAGFALPALILAVLCFYRKTPVAKSSQIFMSSIQLLSHAFASASLIHHTFEPGAIVCTVQSSTVGACFTTSLAVTAVKTEFLVRAFKTPVRVSRRGKRETIAVTLVGTTVLLIVHAAIMLTVHLVCPYVRSVSYTHDAASTFTSCNTRDLTSAQIAFFIAISIACGAQAFRARKLPYNYSEARFIAYAMFTYSVTLFTWIPLNYSLSDVVTKALVSSLLFSAASFEILLLMYGSKLLIILRKPERNTSLVFRMTRMKDLAKQMKPGRGKVEATSWSREEDLATKQLEFSDIDSSPSRSNDLGNEFASVRRISGCNETDS